jgi:hypothetical protein
VAASGATGHIPANTSSGEQSVSCFIV